MLAKYSNQLYFMLPEEACYRYYGVLRTHNKLRVITAGIINVCNKVRCGFEACLISYCCAELTRLIVDITTRARAGAHCKLTLYVHGVYATYVTVYV